MFMSVVAPVPGVSVYPELAGIRVLLTGLDRETGVDVARAFADHKVRLVLQSADASPPVTELVSVLAETAAEIRFFNEPIGADPVRFAQTAVAALAGLDAVVNLVSFTAHELAGLDGRASVEDLVADKLSAAVHITRVAANRMSLTWTEGSILNAVLMPAPTTEREAALAGYVRATLAAMTKGEAQAVSERAVRVNALGPRSLVDAERAGAHLSSGPEIASLALHLASRKGRQLSGHLFDAEQVVLRDC